MHVAGLVLASLARHEAAAAENEAEDHGAAGERGEERVREDEVALDDALLAVGDDLVAAGGVVR